MKFITKIGSETGQKFAAVEKKIGVVSKATRKFMDKIGAEKWRYDPWTVVGGVSAIIFKEGVEVPPFMKKVSNGVNEYMPKLSMKEGKFMHKEINNLPKIDNQELNACIGFDGGPFKTIGFNFNNPEYYLFTLDDDWEFDIPKDCEEITVSRYKELKS